MFKKIGLAIIFYILVGANAFLLNRTLVQAFWPLLQKDQDIISTAVNFAILTPVYIGIFYLIGKVLFKFKKSSNLAEESEGESSLKRILKWVAVKTSLTPLELACVGAGEPKPSRFFFITGMSQVTLGHAILMNYYSSAPTIVIYSVFFLQLLPLLLFLWQMRFEFDLKVSDWKPNGISCLRAAVGAPIFYLCLGGIGQSIYKNFYEVLLKRLISFLGYFSGSAIEADLYSQIILKKFFLTERFLIFSWEASMRGFENGTPWPLMFISLNFFNLYTVLLPILVLFAWQRRLTLTSLKDYGVTLALAFAVSHLPFLISLLLTN